MRNIKNLLTTSMAAVFLLSACGSNAVSEPQVSVVQAIINRENSVARPAPVNSTIAEAMPNFIYTDESGKESSLSDGYVRGLVVDVQQGRSFTWDVSESGETRKEVPFEDSAAMATTYHLQVRVEGFVQSATNQLPQARIDQISKGKIISVGLSLPGRGYFEEFKNEWVGKRTIAALLMAANQVFDYDNSVWPVYSDGRYLGEVNGNSIRFAALTTLHGGGTVEVKALEDSTGGNGKIAIQDGVYRRIK
jgi:hypothetical protein